MRVLSDQFLFNHTITEVVSGKGDERQRQVLQFSDEVIYLRCQELNILWSWFNNGCWGAPLFILLEKEKLRLLYLEGRLFTGETDAQLALVGHSEEFGSTTVFDTSPLGNEEDISLLHKYRETLGVF